MKKSKPSYQTLFVCFLVCAALVSTRVVRGDNDINTEGEEIALKDILEWSDAPTESFRTRSPTPSPSTTPTTSSHPTTSSSPTANPTPHPTPSPTSQPTPPPTLNPTHNPTPSPTRNPTNQPTRNPTNRPTRNPTNRPTRNPTNRPTRNPTNRPTRNPTNRPTRNPTRKPTRRPTSSPTKKPTKPPVAVVDWNYDPSSGVGPKDWEDVKISKDDEYYEWFKTTENQCDGRRQSPQDARDRSTCRDDHNFYTRRGDNMFYETVEFVVLPHSLRLNLFISDSMEDNARADFSNSTPNKVPVPYAEVKIPSEHTLDGKRYAGEYHIAHTWFKDGEGRMVIIAIFLDDGDNEHNPYFEEFIREWEESEWRKRHECTNPGTPYERRHAKRTPDEMLDIWGVEKYKSEKADWSVYAPVTTVYYCGYHEGSITTPPCTEKVWWRILDIPTPVSRRQVRRMTSLLENRLGDNCQVETKMYEGGVNRPIQRNTNKVWCCDKSHWKPSDEDQWRCVWPKNYHSYYC